MALKSIHPKSTAAWSKLQEHYAAIKDIHMLDWFNKDPKRADEFRILWEDFYIDFSKNRIDKRALELLFELAEEVDLQDAISKYFSGDLINQTEGRAVAHMALRAQEGDTYLINQHDVMPEVRQVKKQIKTFSEDIIQGSKRGATGKKFTDIVNIGIGGSDLGPAMVVDALKFYSNHLNPHFISNVDGDHVSEIIKNLNPETTLFVIVSKTFTTQETLSNAMTVRNWFLENMSESAVSNHFVAVSTNVEKVKDFGIHPDNIFPMWDWVGGRYSLWSAVGLSIVLSVGYANFERLLEGANKMDQHFKKTPFVNNIPVVLALISIWYNNFFECETEAVIPYSQYLNQFATYLQQADMESNGKGVDRNGDPIDYQTGHIVWGEPGTNSQHAFFQLIHQGTKLIPADFIGFTQSLHKNKDHQDKLMSNFFAQTEALLKGKSIDEVESELMSLADEDRNKLKPFKVFSGNRPTNTILIKSLTPESLGKLIALYEHKIFVQGVIWNIFSFDQFGVELGKQLAGKILKDFNQNVDENHDPSTSNLIEYYKNLT
ncbi:MAG: glucose-6-phosphate isomerase [Flavobacteriaceae bacterium]|nr:glucose-6-phosphate isomerase [Flavobacteriaceae bacterium]NNL31942.1 glucose-6-phosphate isomerase [Flavobacteriaceae bacterium]